MSKTMKAWLIGAVVLMVVGGMLFGGAMTVLHWDFMKLNTQKTVTNTHSPAEEFTAIAVETDTADVTLMPSEDGTCRVVCKERENARHTVTVSEGTLSVRLVDERKWYQYIGVNFDSPQITVYLPEAKYGALTVNTDTGHVQLPAEFAFESVDVAVSTGDVTCKSSAAQGIRIAASTGDIAVSGVTAGALDLKVSTGKVTVERVTCTGDVSVQVSTGKAALTAIACNALQSTGDTGDIALKNVVGTGVFSIRRSTGDVTFDGCDAAALTIKTETGHVRGTLLSTKIFYTKTDTGRVEVPQSVEGGKCEVETDTGNIRFSILAEK